MNRREEAHRRLDALLDRLDALDGRNSDEGRLGEINAIVPEIAELLAAAGLDRPVKHFFNAEAAEALGYAGEALDARALADAEVVDVRRDEDARAYQVALARAFHVLFGRMLPPVAAHSAVFALWSLSEGGDAAALRATFAQNREVKDPLGEAAARRRMVLKASAEAARDGGSNVERLAKGVGMSAATAKAWNRGVSLEEREAARSLGRALKAGKALQPAEQAIAQLIGSQDWPELREIRRRAMKGLPGDAGG